MDGSRGRRPDRDTEDDGVERLLRAGEHALLVEGDLRAGRRWFDAAYREAERLGDRLAMAEAALGLGGLWASEHRTAAAAAMVRVRQRDALGALDPRSPPALRLRIRLAGDEDYRAAAHDSIFALVDEARAAGDPVALTEALGLAHHCVLGPEHGPLRLELTQELIGEASRTSRRGDLLMGLLRHTADLFLNADPRAERRLAELRGLLGRRDHLAIGYVVSAIEVMLAIRAGRLDEAEALAGACAERGRAAGDVNATGWHRGQLGTIRWYQGRAGELVPMLSELVNSAQLSPVDHSSLAGLAVAAAVAKDERTAAGALARLRGRDLGNLPRSSSWLMTMHGLVEAADMLGDTETAARAYTLLSPFAHLPVMLSLAVTCLGSVHHTLGVASLTAGETDRAVRHLDAAVRDNLALGHWPATALSRFRLGQALLLRNGPQDAQARRQLASAAEEAGRLDMRLPALHEPEGGAPAARCRRVGRHWQVELAGRSALVEHTVGMRHLATLLANPGEEIPAVDLAAGLAASAPAGPGTGQPLLDEAARREYRQRLSRLQAEIDELAAAGAAERADAAREEREWLIAELAAATGIGGRARRFADEHERARIAVGKAIRRALDHIAEADPVIGARLKEAVHTGRRCCYRPR